MRRRRVRFSSWPFVAPSVALFCCTPFGPRPQAAGHSSSAASTSGPKQVALAPRWVLLPSAGASSFELALDSGDKLSIQDGIRMRVGFDGRLETASDRLPATGLTSITLPARLGGGFVFAAEAARETSLWRANSWLGPLTPLTRVEDRLSHIVVGFDRLYLRRIPTGEILGIDLESGANIGPGPLPDAASFQDLAFVDDWFAAVAVDVQGVLVTFNAGETWHSTAIRDSETSLRAESARIQVSPGPQVITRNGDVASFAQTSDAKSALPESPPLFEVPKPEPEATLAKPLGAAPLATAVLHGWPTDRQTALVAAAGALAEVSLLDGAIQQLNLHAYRGSAPCDGIRLGPSTGFVCTERGHGTRLFQYEAPKNLRLVAAFDEPRFVNASDNGMVVVRGACAQAATSNAEGEAGRRLQTYCIIHPPQAPREIRVAGDAGVERVAALADGRVVVLIPPRLGADGRLTIITAAGNQEQKLRLPTSTPEVAALLENGLWLDGVVELERGTLSTWIAGADQYVGVKLELDGKVTVAQPKQGDLRRSVLGGPRALELSAGGIAWQTSDFGFHWQDLALPRGMSPVSPDDVLEPSELNLGCGPVGCSYGNWLRIGYLNANPVRSVATTGPAPDFREAPPPAPLLDNPAQYSGWQLRCYPTGEQLAPVQRGAQATRLPRTQAGVVSGFKTSGLVTTSGVDIDSTANRPFLGVERPLPPRSAFTFDMGADGDSQFRAYAWGDADEAWQKSRGWLLRAADRFRLEAVWSTAVTVPPWGDFVNAAQTFGADRANRSVASWQFEAEPGERSGVVKITSGTSSELHFVEEGRAITSLSGISIGAIAGVVKVNGQWHLGVHDGGTFQVYVADSSGLRKLAEYPVNAAATASLVRTTDSGDLGLMVRTRKGTLHIFPLPIDGEPLEPLVFSREQLNREWPACPADRHGWLVRSGLPMSRIGSSEPSNVLEFEGDAIEWRAQAVLARTILSEATICVEALAAQLSSSEAGASRPRALLPDAPSTIPLVVTDRNTDARTSFRCTP